jgi:TolB-like protein/class 3 adenylate cyclase/Flp pilus assembly protein TadD
MSGHMPGVSQMNGTGGRDFSGRRGCMAVGLSYMMTRRAGVRAMVADQPTRVERKLAAILAADVVGYSRLMHHDEEATHTKLTALLMEAVHPAVADHGGRIVKNTGDGFLAEFASAVEAVRAAVQFQTRIHELTIEEAEDKRIALRVGINIGDVIVEPHDIFGDGVNIAARLESIAEPGGICISSAAYDHVRGKVGVEFADLGEQNLKNIALPVRAYAVGQSGPGSQADRARLDLPTPPRLSIVVLPFANLSGDHKQDYFVDGVTESLITDLSRIRGSFVIGRHTAFTYQGNAVDLKQIGRELNVRYVLEGSLQRSGDRLRINVQLVDAETGAHLWSDRFDKAVADLFVMQDEIVSRLAYALNAQLIVAEATRAERSLHPNSMDLFFQGRALVNQWWTLCSPECLTRARCFFEQAFALDPKNIDAVLGMAAVDVLIAETLYSDDRAARLAAAEAMLVKALPHAPNEALAHLTLADLLVQTNRAAQGIAECKRALTLNRNLGGPHALIGIAKTLMGRAEETEAHINEALRLFPRHVVAHYWLLIAGTAKLQLSADAEAVDWLRRSIETNCNYPLTHFVLAAALALLGSLDEARAVAKAGLALDPSFTIRRYRNGAPSDNPTYLASQERVYQGMRMAGVPER